ncbi:MAG TPA: helix-turn-helix transcriptional regulator [Thermoanaerobaculia bacterium]|nr:helix-turn-helix transcriptional regulator [Thermoanaerobaculia bacterium]
MSTQTTDPREYLKAADVARIIGVAEMIHLATREPVVWRHVRPELDRVARGLKEKYRYALASLGDLLHEVLIERADVPIDRNLPRSAAARRLLLAEDDVYFRIASLLPPGHPHYSGGGETVEDDNGRLVRRILEPAVLQALEQRLMLVQTRLSAAQLKSCVDGCTQGVLTFDAGGRCIFSNPAAEAMLGGTSLDVRSVLRQLPEDRSAPHWLDRITFAAGERALHAFPLFVPDGDAGALLHVFVLAEPDVEAAVGELRRRAALSEREAEVLLLAVEGMSYPAIARELGVKTHTVNTFVDRLSEKLNVNGREEMIKLVYSMLPMLS